jgi:hypothetical protein
MVAGCRVDFSHSACSRFFIRTVSGKATGRPRQPLLVVNQLFVLRPYFRLNRSRPAVSISFCLPVKNGWQFEHISPDFDSSTASATFRRRNARSRSRIWMNVRLRSWLLLLQFSVEAT